MNVLCPNYIQEHDHIIQKADIPFPFVLRGLLSLKEGIAGYSSEGMRDKEPRKWEEKSR